MTRLSRRSLPRLRRRATTSIILLVEGAIGLKHVDQIEGSDLGETLPYSCTIFPRSLQRFSRCGELHLPRGVRMGIIDEHQGLIDDPERFKTLKPYTYPDVVR